MNLRQGYNPRKHVEKHEDCQMRPHAFDEFRIGFSYFSELFRIILPAACESLTAGCESLTAACESLTADCEVLPLQEGSRR